jgi:hypothetical protein
MTPIKGQFVRIIATTEGWKDRIGCVLYVGKHFSRVAVIPDTKGSPICILQISNNAIRDYEP